jgi:hypothetical protein
MRCHSDLVGIVLPALVTSSDLGAQTTASRTLQLAIPAVDSRARFVVAPTLLGTEFAAFPATTYNSPNLSFTASLFGCTALANSQGWGR